MEEHEIWPPLPSESQLAKMGRSACAYSVLGVICWLVDFLIFWLGGLLVGVGSNPNTRTGLAFGDLMIILIAAGLLLFLCGFLVGILSIRTRAGRLGAGIALFFVIGAFWLWVRDVPPIWPE